MSFEQSPDSEFAKRVLERTGVSLEEMQEGSENELLGSHIFCHNKESNMFVVATGYPSRVEDGQEFWDDPKCFRKITVK